MAWEDDFNAGAGGFITADQALFVFQAIGATLILLWAAWIFVTSYHSWGDGSISGSKMLFLWARTVFVMMVLLWLFTN